MVRIIVPFAPGGTSDILARIIAPKLSAALGQTVIVENKTGAAGNVGADAVAKSPKDGHTLLLCDVGSVATSPSLFSNLTYDAEKDLAPVGMIMFAPYVLAVHPSVPVKTAPELIKYGQDNPGKLAMANSGIGGINHIAALIIGKEKNSSPGSTCRTRAAPPPRAPWSPANRTRSSTAPPPRCRSSPAGSSSDWR